MAVDLEDRHGQIGTFHEPGGASGGKSSLKRASGCQLEVCMVGSQW